MNVKESKSDAGGERKNVPDAKKRKCVVHRAKPTICVLFPIGRCLVADDPKEMVKDISKGRL